VKLITITNNLRLFCNYEIRGKNPSCFRWARHNYIVCKTSKTNCPFSITCDLLYGLWYITFLLASLVRRATRPPARSASCLHIVGCATPGREIRPQRILLWEYQHVLGLFILLFVQCVSKHTLTLNRRLSFSCS
jgi:hypothetical protein